MDAVEQYDVDADLESGEAADPALPPSSGESPRERDMSETQVAESAREAAAAAPDLGAALEPLQATLAEGFADLLRAFEDKLAYDRGKERQIDRLHAELQEHKRDLVAKIKRPLIQGIVRLHDDLGKVVAALGRRKAEELTPERFFRALDGFADDIELLLGQHGVETCHAPGEDFDPRRQTALRTETTNDPELAGTVAERLRPGFAEGETLLQKERVAVYAAVPSSSAPPPASAGARGTADPAVGVASGPPADREGSIEQ